MQQYTYTVVFERLAEGGFIASVPALPGCATQAETFEEAEANIKDAITGYLAVLREDGDEIPTESPEHFAGTTHTGDLASPVFSIVVSPR